MATVVHTNADGTTHTHGPTSAKIVALGTVSLGGATFMIDRDGQIEAGRTTEFGIEHAPPADVETDAEEAASKRRRKSVVVPTGAWIANPDGKKLCEAVAPSTHAINSSGASSSNRWWSISRTVVGSHGIALYTGRMTESAG